MFNIKSIHDLPSIGRLNTVHHDGVRTTYLFRTFFCFLQNQRNVRWITTVIIRIVVRGYYLGKWHSSFYVVYESPFIREILPIWYDTVMSIGADQNVRHGFVDVYFDPPLDNLLGCEPSYGPDLPFLFKEN